MLSVCCSSHVLHARVMASMLRPRQAVEMLLALKNICVPLLYLIPWQGLSHIDTGAETEPSWCILIPSTMRPFSSNKMSLSPLWRRFMGAAHKGVLANSLGPALLERTIIHVVVAS